MTKINLYANRAIYLSLVLSTLTPSALYANEAVKGADDSQTVHMPYDQSTVDSKTQQFLDGYFSGLKKSGFEGDILLAGHVGRFKVIQHKNGDSEVASNEKLTHLQPGDELVLSGSTTEYAMAAGERYARAVKEIAAANGLKNNLLETLSYGVEKNAAPYPNNDKDVDEWNRIAALNNRVDITVYQAADRLAGAYTLTSGPPSCPAGTMQILVDASKNTRTLLFGSRHSWHLDMKDVSQTTEVVAGGCSYKQDYKKSSNRFSSTTTRSNCPSEKENGIVTEEISRGGYDATYEYHFNQEGFKCVYTRTDVSTAQFEAILAQAKAGDINAQFTVANMYYGYNTGAPHNEVQATRWYLEAAKQEHPLAQYRLAVALMIGDGIAKDLPQSAVWVSRSAENGFAEAQSTLAALYFGGQGVTQSYTQAYIWFSIALKNPELDLATAATAALGKETTAAKLSAQQRLNAQAEIVARQQKLGKMKTESVN